MKTNAVIQVTVRDLAFTFSVQSSSVTCVCRVTYKFFYTARSAGQKGCVNMPLLRGWGRLVDQSQRSRKLKAWL